MSLFRDIRGEHFVSDILRARGWPSLLVLPGPTQAFTCFPAGLVWSELL